MKARPPERKKRSRDAAPADATPSAVPAIDGGRGIRNVLYLVFALSGLTGLVYEATWTRYLQLFLGHGAFAVHGRHGSGRTHCQPLEH
jgi:hypothetical protein